MKRGEGLKVKKRVRFVLFPFLLLCSFSGLLAQGDSPQRSWVFLRDKGVSASDLQGIDPHTLGISERALKRRAKVLPADRLLDSRDLPVAPEYLEQLRAMGFKVHATSRWLNAVSVEASPAQIIGLLELSFVQSAEIVGRAQRPQPPISHPPTADAFFKRERTNGIDYGVSITQLQNIKVPEVHSLGITGAGVLVGMIDDGFNNHKTHNALKNIQVLAEYDWIQGDSITSSQMGDSPGQGDHGASTMSVLAGFENGKLIGPAFGASLILAKSEFDPTETQIELDNYVAALEWMERMGADVVSTSLGYDDLDPFRQNNPGDIVYSMKNGRTAVTSKAANAAANKGVLLVTSMGNEGPWRFDDTWQTVTGSTGSLVTPADADSIIAVGATLSNAIRASFSSTGPTSDGRIKPEVVAQVSAIVAADGQTT
ncbi:MAG: S8 family serine peptidase, partial [Bacteroidota bacterium]